MMYVSRGLSRASRRFRGKIFGEPLSHRQATACRNLLPCLDSSLGDDPSLKVLGCRHISSWSWGLPAALYSIRHHIHHHSASIVEEQLDPFSLVADELSILANRLRAMVVAEVPKLASAAEYFFRMGVEGKRFRPTVLLLMSTALNVSIHKPPPDTIMGDTMTAELRVRQQSIAEITEMIH
ncbi:hypothetical protein CRG98_001028, partial [Punica granatum]